MIDYTREELINLLKKNPERFNEWKAEQEEVDLSEVDFSGINLHWFSGAGFSTLTSSIRFIR